MTKTNNFSAGNPLVSSEAVPSRDSSAQARDIIDRVLSRSGTALASTAAQHERGEKNDAGALERAERAALTRVAGLSTELEDVSEVEYRQIRLEKVVLIGIYSTNAQEAEYSLRES